MYSNKCFCLKCRFKDIFFIILNYGFVASLCLSVLGIVHFSFQKHNMIFGHQNPKVYFLNFHIHVAAQWLSPAKTIARLARRRYIFCHRHNSNPGIPIPRCAVAVNRDLAVAVAVAVVCPNRDGLHTLNFGFIF